VYCSGVNLSGMSGLLQYLLGPRGRFFSAETGVKRCLFHALVMQLWLPYGQTIGCQIGNDSMTYCLSGCYPLLGFPGMSMIQTSSRRVLGLFPQVSRSYNIFGTQFIFTPGLSYQITVSRRVIHQGSLLSTQHSSFLKTWGPQTLCITSSGF